MKVARLTATFLIAGWILAASLVPTGQAAAAEPSPEWTAHRMIAHAMGGISGQDYTNTYEAFLVNYEKKHRVFEADLILTEDGKLAARHDWEAYLTERLQPQVADDRKGQPLTMDEFKGNIVSGKYQSLLFDDIVKLMVMYPDIYLVTDTKETEPELVRKQFEEIKSVAEAIDPSVLERIIPELYSEEMYAQVMDIYAFPNLLYSLYMSGDSPEQVISFVMANGIQTVAMPKERAEMFPDLVKTLDRMGVKVYTHATNSVEEIQQLQKLGVYGIYTDFMANRTSYFENGESQTLKEYALSFLSKASGFVYFFVFAVLVLILHRRTTKIQA